MIYQPLQDCGRLVGGDIIEDDMDIHVGIEVFGCMVEEGHEVLGAMVYRSRAPFKEAVWAMKSRCTPWLCIETDMVRRTFDREKSAQYHNG